MMWSEAQLVPFCCIPASMLRCCEHWAHIAVQAGFLWVMWVGMGAYLQRREKMRDRSHSQSAVPEWFCLAPKSTLSNPNEKFQTSSKVGTERGNVFPPLLSPILDNIFKSLLADLQSRGKIMDSTHLKACVTLIGRWNGVKMHSVSRWN